MYLLNYFLNFKVLHFEFFEAWSNPRFFTCPIPWGRWNQYGFLCWFWNSLHLHHWITRLGTIRIPVARIKFRRGEKKSILLTIYETNVSFIPYFRLLVFGILVTLVAWFSFRFFSVLPILPCKIRNAYYFCNFVTKMTKNEKWDERNNDF